MTQYSKSNYTKGVDRAGNSLEKKSKRVGECLLKWLAADNEEGSGMHQ